MNEIIKNEAPKKIKGFKDLFWLFGKVLDEYFELDKITPEKSQELPDNYFRRNQFEYEGEFLPNGDENPDFIEPYH